MFSVLNSTWHTRMKRWRRCLLFDGAFGSWASLAQHLLDANSKKASHISGTKLDARRLAEGREKTSALRQISIDLQTCHWRADASSGGLKVIVGDPRAQRGRCTYLALVARWALDETQQYLRHRPEDTIRNSPGSCNRAPTQNARSLTHLPNIPHHPAATHF